MTYKDKFPLPHIKDCLRALGGLEFVSLIDLSNSFYQVGLAQEDRDKTAFVTRRGQWRLTRLGQGCTNSPAIFCRLMAMVLRGLTCCLAYIDDTICFSGSFEDHLVDLEAVFDRFRRSGLKLMAQKCRLFQTRCKFVGHIVSKEGIEVDPAKVGCIVNWQFPRTVSELRSFLGLCSYYRMYIKGFANIADPLTECLRKGVTLSPTPERLAAFEMLKEKLTSAPILAVPRDDLDCLYVMDSDASGTGASAILQQWQGAKLRVIEYASRTFNATERLYCATRREMAALIFGLEQFRPYLLGRHFQVRVDNAAVSFYHSMKDATGQAARYLDLLSLYDFEIIHRSGTRHVNADAVSRIRPCELDNNGPCKQCHRRIIGEHRVSAVTTRSQRRKQLDRDDCFTGSDAVNTSQQPVEPTADNRGWGRKCRHRRRHRAPSLQATAPQAWAAGVSNWTPAAIRDMQLVDVNIGPAISWLESGIRPPWSEVEACSPMLRALWQQFDSLVIIDGILYRSIYNSVGEVVNHQLILPSTMKVPFLDLIHANTAGHLKLAKCMQHVSRRAWWLHWRRDLKLFIKCCPKCEAYHRGQPPRQAYLRPMMVGAPGERWAIDLAGMHVNSNGYRYMFTAIDPFSKYGICVPIRNKEASTVACVMVNHIFL